MAAADIDDCALGGKRGPRKPADDVVGRERGHGAKPGHGIAVAGLAGRMGGEEVEDGDEGGMGEVEPLIVVVREN